LNQAPSPAAAPLSAPGRGVLARLAGATCTAPERLLWAFIALHGAVWTALGPIMRPNFPVDVIEMLVWGREWQWGYFKHPPLPAWVLEAADWATGASNWTPYFVSQLFVGVTFWAVWKLGVEIVGPRRALLAVVALAGVGGYDYGAMQFNHNVAQYPFWALLGWSLYKALRGGGVRDWLLVGVWTALGLLAKYQTIALLVPLALFVLAEPQARRWLRTPLPYMAMAVAFVLLLPNLIWLVEHDAFGPARFLMSRTLTRHGTWGHLLYPLDFAINMVVWCGLAFVALALLRWRTNELPAARQPDAFDRAYILVLAAGPLAFTLALSALTGLGAREDWGTPMLCFVGLLGVTLIAPAIDRQGLRRFWAMAIAMSVGVLVTVVAVQQVIDPYRRQPGTYFFPGRTFATGVTEGWRAMTNGAPLRYVIGSSYVGGNVAYYAPDRPSLYIEADPWMSPWIDEDKLRRTGAVIVWQIASGRPDAPPAGFAARFPAAIVQTPITEGGAWPRFTPITLGWALLPPQPR
jgi:hypothetical protein